jgi:hypothetical protein
MTPDFEKSPGVVESEVLMTRAARMGTILLVEGPDDARFWRYRVEGNCTIIHTSGKPNLEMTMLRLNGKGTAGVLGIVDDDHDSLRGIKVACSNIVRTDAHDLECMLLRANALERILAEFGAPNLITAFEAREGCTVGEALVKRALPFGRLRLLSAINGWGLDFKRQLSVGRFLPRSSWVLEEVALKSTTLANGCPLDMAGLDRALLQVSQLDSWYVCHGHDFVDILAIGLHKVLGSVSGVGARQIGSVLRSAVDRTVLASCGLCTDILDWQTNNHPFLVFGELAV